MPDMTTSLGMHKRLSTRVKNATFTQQNRIFFLFKTPSNTQRKQVEIEKSEVGPVHTCTKTPGGSNGAFGVRERIWLAFKDPLTDRRVYSDGRTERHYFKVAASLVLISLMKNTFLGSGWGPRALIGATKSSALWSMVLKAWLNKQKRTWNKWMFAFFPSYFVCEAARSVAQ